MLKNWVKCWLGGLKNSFKNTPLLMRRSIFKEVFCYKKFLDQYSYWAMVSANFFLFKVVRRI